MGRTKHRSNNEGTISARPNAKGLYVGAFHEPNGRRRYFYGKTAAIVRGKMEEARGNIRIGKPATPDKTKLGDFLDQWLADTVKPKVRSRTFESYNELCQLHIKPCLGNIALGKLTPQDAQAWMNAKRAAGLSPRRVEYMRAVLRIALGQAERWDLVHRNVAKLVDPPRKNSEEVHPYTQEELKAFLKAIQGHRYEYVYLVAVATGMRQGELLGLSWPDVDFASEVIHIRQTLERGRAGWKLAEAKTKRSNRTLRMPQVALNALLAQKARQKVERERAADRWEEHGLVFTDHRGHPLRGSSVGHSLNLLQDNAKLRRCRFHDLRHLAASLQLAGGASLREVQEMLGHSTIVLTANLYTHIQEAMKAEAAARMDKALSFDPA